MRFSLPNTSWDKQHFTQLLGGWVYIQLLFYTLLSAYFPDESIHSGAAGSFCAVDCAVRRIGGVWSGQSYWIIITPHKPPLLLFWVQQPGGNFCNSPKNERIHLYFPLFIRRSRIKWCDDNSNPSYIHLPMGGPTKFLLCSCWAPSTERKSCEKGAGISSAPPPPLPLGISFVFYISALWCS